MVGSESARFVVRFALGVAFLFAIFPAHAEVASIYGGGDGLCGHRTASGASFNCSAMTAAHRTLPFGTRVRVCYKGCVIVTINDRGPWVRHRDIDLSPAAARAIGLSRTGTVQMLVSE
jgi:rare lipoprotein A